MKPRLDVLARPARRIGRPIPLITLCAVGLVVAGVAHAGPWAFVGSRQQAMGGAGVATTSDSTANYWNPANLAFQKGWGVALPITADASIENNALEKLSELLLGFDELSQNAQEFINCPTCGPPPSPGEADAIVDLLGQFVDYGQGGEAVHVNASVGLAGRYQNFGFSALSLTTGTVFPNTDLDNISLGAEIADLVQAGTPALPNNIQLRDAVRDNSPFLNQDQANQLVLLFEQNGVDTSDPRAQQLVLGLAGVGAAGGLAANNTGALVAGLSTQEFAFSYALKIPVPYIKKTRGTTRNVLNMVHNKLAVSVVPKYMLGVTFVKFFRYDEEEGVGGIVSEIGSIEGSQVSSAFGLDVGVSYRPTPWLHFGLMARNVNTPSSTSSPLGLPSDRRSPRSPSSRRCAWAWRSSRSRTSRSLSTSTPRRTRSGRCRDSALGSSPWAASTSSRSIATSRWRCAWAATATSRTRSATSGP